MSFSAPISLTAYEMMIAAHHGAVRNATARYRPDVHGFDEEHGWNIHIEGACGEVAVAKALGRYWEPTVNTFHDPDIRAPDLGIDIQVRTRSRHDYELIIRPDDPPCHAYVLVTGRAPHFRIWGYRLGHDIRRPDWLKEHGGRPAAWFVPQAELWDWRGLRYPMAQSQNTEI